MTPAFASDAVLEKIGKTKEIVIGYPVEALPFSYRANGNEPIGYSIDLCRQVTMAIQQKPHLPALKIRFHPLSFKDRLDAVSSNAVDLECGSTTNTPQRQEKVAFSVSTFAATIKAVVRQQDGLQRVKDLNGRTVVIVEGTTVGQLVSDVEKKEGLSFRKVYAKNLTEGFQAFVDKKADGLIFDDVVVAPLIAGKPEYRFLDDVLAVEHLGLIFPRDNPETDRGYDTGQPDAIGSGGGKLPEMVSICHCANRAQSEPSLFQGHGNVVRLAQRSRQYGRLMKRRFLKRAMSLTTLLVSAIRWR